MKTINHVVVNHSTIQPFHHQPGWQSSNPKTAPGCLGDLLGTKCYPVKWEFFEMNHDKRIFRPFFVPQVELTTSISPFHHFTIKCWNHPTFYFHFNPQNKAVWWTLPHLTFPSEISGGPMRLMPRRRKSNPCMAKSPRCVVGQTFDDVLPGWQVGSGLPWWWFFFGPKSFQPTQNPQLNLVSKGEWLKHHINYWISNNYIYTLYTLYTVYTLNQVKTLEKHAAKTELSGNLNRILHFPKCLTSWHHGVLFNASSSGDHHLASSNFLKEQLQIGKMIRVVLYKHYHLRFKQHQQKHAGMYQFRWRYPAATSTVHVPAGRWTISQKSPQFDSSELCPSLVPKQFPLHFTLVPKNHKKKLTQPMCFIKNDTPGCAFLSFCNDFNDGPGSHIQDFLLSKPRAENEARSWVIDQDTNSSKQGSIILMSGIF